MAHLRFDSQQSYWEELPVELKVKIAQSLKISEIRLLDAFIIKSRHAWRERLVLCASLSLPISEASDLVYESDKDLMYAAEIGLLSAQTREIRVNPVMLLYELDPLPNLPNAYNRKDLVNITFLAMSLPKDFFP